MTEQQKQKIQNFQLTSDIFFGVALSDTIVCEEVLSILLNQKIKIKNVQSQYSIRQLLHHSVVLDILAIDETETHITMEMHPQRNEDQVKRMRYNLSSIDTELLYKSTDYGEIPDVCGIYITKGDLFHTEKGINHIVHFVEGTEQQINNGTSEYYINLNSKGNTPEQTLLMQYMMHSDEILESDIFPNLVKRVRWLKEEQGGNEIMCEIVDEFMRESKREGKRIGEVLGTIHTLRFLNYTNEEISKHLIERMGLAEKQAEKLINKS